MVFIRLFCEHVKCHCDKENYVIGGHQLNSFLVFMCPKCQNFTNAPAGQKRRRCSYCGFIIDITRAAVDLADDQIQASEKVRQYNASRGGDEFERSVERSRERVRELLPKVTPAITTAHTEDAPEVLTGKRARLLSILEKHAKDQPLSLDRLEDFAHASMLDWVWVEKQLNFLANNGALIFPRPWTVKLVRLPDPSEDKDLMPKDVSQEILNLLKQSKDGLDVEYIMRYFDKKGVLSKSVELSLEKLMKSGEIYEPHTGNVRII